MFDAEKNKRRDEFKKRIYRYILRMIKFLNQLPNYSVIREIKSQLTRSGTSIGANYFEAESASSKKDYQNFFFISLKSANETKFWLNVVKDAELVTKNHVQECNYLLQETTEIAKIFASSILTMKKQKNN